MDMEKYIVSIEMSTTQVALILASVDEKNKYGVKILHSEARPSAGMIRGRVVNWIEMKRVVSNLLMHKNISKKQGNIFYILSVNGLDFRDETRNVDLKEANMTISANNLTQLRNMIETSNFFGNDEVAKNFSLRQFLIDDSYSVPNPIGCQCDKIEASYLMTVIKRELQTNYIDLINNNEVKAIYPVASSKSVILLAPEEQQNGVALVDFGASTTSVAVFNKGILQYEFSLPIGSNLITTDIMKALELSEEHAECLKKTFGIQSNEDTDYQKFLPTFPDGEKAKKVFLLNDLKFYARARAEEMIDYVNSVINSKNDLRDRVKKFVITGGGSKLKGLDKLIEKRLNRPVETIYSDGDYAPEFICAIGMASRFARENATLFSSKEPGQLFNTEEKEETEKIIEDDTGKSQKNGNGFTRFLQNTLNSLTDESNEGSFKRK